MGDWGSDWSGPLSGVSPVKVLAQSAVAVPHTGDTNETILATIPIPAGAIGKNGRLAVSMHVSCTNSASNKVFRVRFGASGSGTGGTALGGGVTLTTSVQGVFLLGISNRGATNSQIGSQVAMTIGSSGSAVTTASADTTAATEINITGQLALGSETITLEAYQVLLYPLFS